MSLTKELKKEMSALPKGVFCPEHFFAKGYFSSAHSTPYERKADGIVSLFCDPEPFIYKNDLIVGSIYPLILPISDEERQSTRAKVSAVFTGRKFHTNFDHYSPDYETVLSIGIDGLLERISDSEKDHSDDADALAFLNSARMTLTALQKRILAHCDLARALSSAEGYDKERLSFIEKNCRALLNGAPKSFAEALQLVWFIHTCFLFERRYAMALGRMDQYLYPFYKKDLEDGRLTKDGAVELLENLYVKICESRFFKGDDDVVNICIGGVDSDGACAVNELSYLIVTAVKNVNMPGPNLSARITPDTPDSFLDACLISIGTGLGYPALMNDSVNMAALRRFGYDEKDIRNYSMVGCIENFITGMQPPWSDGRFDTPRYLEYLLFDGEGYDESRKGIRTAPLSEITSMELFMENLEEQISFGVESYVQDFNEKNIILDPENYSSPFLSCFCKDCIGRGRDINMGGSRYPSVHGAALMGVGTMSDSLAAIEKVVFNDKEATLEELAAALKANFEGYEPLREKLLAAPKYGNNDQFVDKYAVWFTSFLSGQFDRYRTYDGGGFYTAMAANTSNIDAGKKIGATPDGRLAKAPLSDAASPTYGRDTKGMTSALLSLSKPDYTRCACGTVVNQKYSPSMFTDGKREKLLQLIKVYFSKGGQELQINATSSDILRDAMKHPENYGSLVVRVSGFSALYVTLDRDVQEDILRRTQYE
ncbi:MAG: hypothetical protein E7641_06295 [Ruminococcaceae bacterium]|nr:hypothetical protein [Oscillospiraceae bacterium]